MSGNEGKSYYEEESLEDIPDNSELKQALKVLSNAEALLGKKQPLNDDIKGKLELAVIQFQSCLNNMPDDHPERHQISEDKKRAEYLSKGGK